MRRLDPEIRRKIRWWTIFWTLWAFPCAFPLMGLPFAVVLIVLGIEDFDMHPVAFCFTVAIYGLLTITVTKVAYLLAPRRQLGRRPLPFVVVYAFVFFLPMIIGGILHLFVRLHGPLSAGA